MNELLEKIAELEAALEISRQEARGTREMFQLAMDSIPWCIWWKDTEGRYLGCNRHLTEAAGLRDVSDLIGKTDLDVWDRDDAIKYRTDDSRIMASGRPEVNILERQIRSGGTVHFVETNKVPLLDGQGVIIGTLGTFQDVTERQMLQEEVRRHRDELEVIVEERTRKLGEEIAERQAAEARLVQQARELAEANQALREAEKAKSAFFANVSHELRTPLTLILAPVESALSASYGSISPDLHGALSTVHNSALRLLELVSSILDMSRLEAGKLTFQPVATQSDRLLDTLLRDFLPLAEKRSQSLTWRLEDGATRSLDPYLLERILYNLVSNALKFTPQGGRVEVEEWVDDNWLHLQVRDDGIGIAAEDQVDLFRKFHQVESSFTRKYEGTGLGLAMVREFTQLMGGAVELRSARGEGTVILVRIPAPLAAGEPAPPMLHPKPTAVAGREDWVGALRGEGPEILIAEDNEELACYVAQILQDLGRIRWAPDGEVALQMFRECRPALVVSDVMMPRRDGLSLCREIQKEPDPPPVLLLTALAERKALLDAWDAGAADFLTKPFHAIELTTRARSLLHSRAERERAALEKRKLEERLFEAQKLDSLGLMAGGVAHDFNNLLSVVIGNLELVEMMEPRPAEVMESLREASRASQRAAELSRQMLTYVGQVPPKKDTLDLAAATRDIGGFVSRGLLPKPILHMNLKTAFVEADRSQLHQVLLNLVTNAAESGCGRQRVDVWIETGVRHFPDSFLEGEKGGTFAYIRVEDSGMGMDDETRRRVFDPFFSTKFTGRGLGLAAVHGILRSHRAHSRIESVPGQGTVFWVLFPLSSKQATEMVEPASSSWTGNGAVLVVDDEPQVRKVMAGILKVSGFEVIQAGSVEEAKEIATPGRGLRAAVLDIILPDGDGYQLAEALQSRFPELPCLLCSGYQGDREREAAYRLLPKPFSVSELQDALRQLLC